MPREPWNHRATSTELSRDADNHHNLHCGELVRFRPKADISAVQCVGSSAKEGRPVPRFFFHVFDDAVSIDESGQPAEDLDGAREIALNGARELVCDQVRRGYLNLENYIVVTDQTGQELLRVTFREAFVERKVVQTTSDFSPGGKLPD